MILLICFIFIYMIYMAPQLPPQGEKRIPELQTGSHPNHVNTLEPKPSPPDIGAKS
jgi:hypothetical protein